MKIAQIAALCFACFMGLMPVAAFAQPYQISADGTEVTDQNTGLIWRRCAEGLTWDGTTCAGSPGTFAHEAALQRAAAQATASKAWRLPNIKELSNLADKTRANPAIDPTVFPATPPNYFWSASPNVGNSSGAWYVDFSYGNVDSYNRSSFYVRLVRAVSDWAA